MEYGSKVIGASIDRRRFLAGGAMGVLGIAGAGAASALAAEKSSPSDSAASQQAADDFAVAPAAIADDQVSDTVESDVVVIGAGHSGLCCALSALQAGGTVTVVTASSTPIARGGSNNAVNSKAMQEQGVPPVDVQKMMLKELMANSSRVDQRKWARYFQNSEESMDWLIDIMADAGFTVGIEGAAPYPEDSPFYTPSASHGFLNADYTVIGMTQQAVVDTLAQRILDAGGRIDYGTVALQLVRGGVANGTDGRVDAVIAQTQDGSYIKYVGTKGVVMATGDFSADRAMMEKYCPQAVDFMDSSIADANANYDAAFQMGGLYKGDGQKMGLWVGAAWQHNPICTPMMVSSGTATTKPYCCFWGLKLNANGERFMNEDCPGAFGSFGTSTQPGGTAYCIWDDAYADGETDWRPSNSTFDTPAMTADEIKATWTDSYDTLEEAIEALGLPTEQAMAAIERYNELCDAGQDSDFFKDPTKMKPIRTAPFHTGVEQNAFLTVMGGLRTNENMQVCDENDEPIPGLYNVGTMVGDMYSNIYTFMMEGFNYGATCLTFGKLTGEYIMENE